MFTIDLNTDSKQKKRAVRKLNNKINKLGNALDRTFSTFFGESKNKTEQMQDRLVTKLDEAYRIKVKIDLGSNLDESDIEILNDMFLGTSLKSSFSKWKNE